MHRTLVKATAILSILMLPFASVFAGDSEEDIKQRMGSGDPVAGKEKSSMCQGCHGEDGNSATADYPKLSGQYAAYIIKQVNNFKSGLRKDPMMSAMAASVADEDMPDIAAYFASQKQMKSARGVVNQAGKARFLDDGNGCGTCHGVNGKGLAPNMSQAPVIGGQHRDYLIKQLMDFRGHTRTNDPGGIMGMIAGFMSEQDVKDVASYISGL